MRLKLQYTLLLMATGWLSASCTSEIPDNGVKSGSEMQFAVTDASRSSATTDLNYEGSQFAIFGDMTFVGSASSSSSGSFVIFNGIPVTYDGSKWAYSNLQYWFPEYEYSFVAVHPTVPAETADMTYSGSSLSFGYTLPEAFGDTPDLLVATHRRMYDGGSADPVRFRFAHAMSRINFLLTNADAAETVKATKIELEGVNKSGTFAITPAPLSPDSKQTDDYELSWTDFSNAGSLVAAIEVSVPETEKRPLFPDDNTLFVIPQPDNEGIIVKITYTLIYKNGNTEERTLAATTSIGGWLPGKVYTYSLTFGADIKEIEINVSVNDWEMGSIDDVQVPRK